MRFWLVKFWHFIEKHENRVELVTLYYYARSEWGETVGPSTLPSVWFFVDRKSYAYQKRNILCIHTLKHELCIN